MEQFQVNNAEIIELVQRLSMDCHYYCFLTTMIARMIIKRKTLFELAVLTVIEIDGNQENNYDFWTMHFVNMARKESNYVSCLMGSKQLLCKIKSE